MADTFPLRPGQILWTVNRTNGQFEPFVGPDPLALTNDDMPMMPDPDNPGGVIQASSTAEAVQDFVVVQEGREYVIVHNPVASPTTEHPNGPSSKGKTPNPPTLNQGSQRVITRGTFPLWPTQWIERKPVHTLRNNQFLVVEVVGEVDKDAPYYDLTVNCANIRKAVVEDVSPTASASEDDAGQPRGSDSAEDADGASKAEDGNVAKSDRDDDGGQPPSGTASSEAGDSNPTLEIGQLIIIPGNVTQKYIPPSGCVVTTEETGDQPTEEAPAEPSAVIERAVRSGRLTADNAVALFSRAALDDPTYYAQQVGRYLGGADPEMPREVDMADEHVEAAVRGRRQVARRPDTTTMLLQELESNVGQRGISQLAVVLQEKVASQDAHLKSDDPAVRQAVVLSPTEYCVLLNEEGAPVVKAGPGRVFPGPYDTFRTEESRNRIYDAYHLRADRGLLLRVIADKTSKSELLEDLPDRAKDQLTEDTYRKGDEIFIHGFDAYVVPSDAYEIIVPTTKVPHIGNDHTNVYVQGIPVDSESGVYIESIQTGAVMLVKGEKMVLVDPREDRHVHKRVDREMWNLLIGFGEPSKKTDQPHVKSPWALNVTVPNGMAMLLHTKDSRRVVIGPCKTLVGYKEWPEVLQLSTGTPKSDNRLLKTCFLRVEGNFVSDVVEVETQDHVKLRIPVSVGVDFEAEGDDDQQRWFNHQNYVKLLTDRIGSILRAKARSMPLAAFYPKVADLVRDWILGEKPTKPTAVDGGDSPDAEAPAAIDAHRPGLFFVENGMRVVELDVGDVEIPDEEVRFSMEQAFRTVATLEIGNKQREAELQSARLRAELDKEQHTLDIDEVSRKLTLQSERTKSDTAVRELRERGEAALAAVKREIEAAQAEHELRMRANDHEEDRAHQEAVAEREKSVTEALAAADEKRMKAIQPHLIAAIEALGDKQVLAELAEHLPQATGDLGLLAKLGGIGAVSHLVAGTRLEQRLGELGPLVGRLENGNGHNHASEEVSATSDGSSSD